MSDIEALVKEIEVKKLLANSEPGTNPLSFTSKKGKIKRAKIDLEELETEYRQEVKSRALFIIATGTQADKFAKIAKEEFYCYSLDSNQFYYDITEDINERLYTDAVTSPALFDILGKTFEEKAREIGIVSYPALIFESKYKKILNKKEDLISIVKRAFNEKIGAEVLGLDAIQKITKEALKSEDVDRKILQKFPIIMITKDETLVKDLAKGLRYSSPNVHIVGVGTVKDKDVKDNCMTSIKTVSKDSVEKGLVKISSNSK